jgi:hypothetical protein
LDALAVRHVLPGVTGSIPAGVSWSSIAALASFMVLCREYRPVLAANDTLRIGDSCDVSMKS